MMQAAASSSVIAAEEVLQLVIPLLLEQFHKHHIVSTCNIHWEKIFTCMYVATKQDFRFPNLGATLTPYF
jgi:hypothetical protein